MNKNINKESNPPSKKLHPRSLHKNKYDFNRLIKVLPELAKHTKQNPAGEITIDFNNNESVVLLNKALLKLHYNINFWDIPTGYLCPPIPSRADYVHHLADLISDNDKIKVVKTVNILDIGTGANAIYPIIGATTYGWKFTASDINPISIKTVTAISQLNKNLTGLIKPILQKNPNAIFDGVIAPTDYFAATICNPPFHASAEDATFANVNKQKKLAKNKTKKSGIQNKSVIKSQLNFGGQNAELWCAGGEIRFLTQMINESVKYKRQVGWFTSLVSKKANVAILKKLLQKRQAKNIKVITMQHGQKQTRIIAWQF